MAKKTLRYAVKHVYPHMPVTLFNTKYEALRFINDNGHNHIATVGYRVLVKLSFTTRRFL